MTKALLTSRDIELFIKEVVKDLKPIQPILLDKTQTAKELGITVSTFRTLVDKGLPNSNCKGRRKKYYLPEVVKWLRDNGLSRYLVNLKEHGEDF